MHILNANTKIIYEQTSFWTAKRLPDNGRHYGGHTPRALVATCSALGNSQSASSEGDTAANEMPEQAGLTANKNTTHRRHLWNRTSYLVAIVTRLFKLQ